MAEKINCRGEAKLLKMNKSKKIFVITELVLAGLIILMAFIIFQEKRGKALGKISVIIQDSDDNQWSAFKYGLKMAARDKGAEMFVVSTGKILTPEEQMEVINGEIDNGADAVIVQPAPGMDTKKLGKRLKKHVPVMLVGRTVSRDGRVGSPPGVGPDNYAMGQALAEELLNDYNGSLKGKTLGVMAEMNGSVAVAERLEGFEEAVEGHGAKLSWRVTESFGEGESNSLAGQTKVDIVVALDDKSLTTAGACGAANDLHGALVYGIGNSTEAVYYLDTGVAECLIIPDDFNIGYHSLTEVAEKLGFYFYGMKNKKVSYRVIRREELFHPENQEILFAISQ